MPPGLSRLSASLAAGALLGSAACHDATAPAPLTPVPVSAEIIAALADIDARVLPALDSAAQSPMRAALDDLRNALLANNAPAAHRAAHLLRTLTTSANATGDTADLSAIALVVDVAQQSLEVAR